MSSSHFQFYMMSSGDDSRVNIGELPLLFVELVRYLLRLRGCSSESLPLRFLAFSSLSFSRGCSRKSPETDNPDGPDNPVNSEAEEANHELLLLANTGIGLAVAFPRGTEPSRRAGLSAENENMEELPKSLGGGSGDVVCSKSATIKHKTFVCRCLTPKCN